MFSIYNRPLHKIKERKDGSLAQHGTKSGILKANRCIVGVSVDMIAFVTNQALFQVKGDYFCQ